MNNIFNLTIKNEKSIIPEIALFVAGSAEKLGLSKKRSRMLCFALESVLELRTDHISENNPEVKLSVEDSGSEFVISVTDFGAPYILTANQRAILKKGLVDRYSFAQMGRKGQCFSFVFKYDAPAAELPLKKAESPNSLSDTNFIFRALKDEDEDVLKAVECLYEAYGYEYYHQNLYSVEAFRKYLKGGHYLPILCENEHGEVASYCALDENTWFMGVPELSNLVTSPIARGQGIATKMFEESERIAKEEGFEGVHVSAVAYHPYTQKMCNKFGYTPCAVEYSINPAGTGGYDKDRRLDCVIGVKVFNKEKHHELFLSNELEEIISKIFASEEMDYSIDTQKSLPADDSMIEYVVDADTDNCFMKIDACALDFEDEIARLLAFEEVAAMDVVTVNLNMNNPSSRIGYDALKKLGFIVGGCIPGSKTADYMLLQKFKVEPAYDKIVLETGYKELAEILRKIN